LSPIKADSREIQTLFITCCCFYPSRFQWFCKSTTSATEKNESDFYDEFVEKLKQRKKDKYGTHYYWENPKTKSQWIENSCQGFYSSQNRG